MYSGASLLRTLNKPLLYSSCFCRLIILVSVNFWSVVRVVSVEKNIFTAFQRERERQRDKERQRQTEREREKGGGGGI